MFPSCLILLTIAPSPLPLFSPLRASHVSMTAPSPNLANMVVICEAQVTAVGDTANEDNPSTPLLVFAVISVSRAFGFGTVHVREQYGHLECRRAKHGISPDRRVNPTAK